MSCSGSDHQVLLVEDSEDDVFFFERVTRRAGLNLHITHAPNGLAAIDVLKTALAAPVDTGHCLPKCVFLDLKMPECNGFEVLAWVRQQPALADLKIIVLSGSEDAADIRRALSLGAIACYTKPIQAEQLHAVFKSLAHSASLVHPRPLSSNVSIFMPAE